MLKLNIYGPDNVEVVKTYEAEAVDLMYGNLEDLVGIVDPDRILPVDTKEGQWEMGKMILKVLPLIKPFFKEIFPGLTDEEMRRTKVKEIIRTVIEAVKYAINGIAAQNEDGVGN